MILILNLDLLIFFMFESLIDHPMHGVSMLGGMWGAKSHMNRELMKSIFDQMLNRTIAEHYKNGKTFYAGGDQEFLKKVVWPDAKQNSTIHDSYHCKKYGGVGFPSKRLKPNCFIACVGECCNMKVNDTMHFPPCPVECRPAEHKDWEYC